MGTLFFCRGIAGFVPPEGSASRQKAAGQKRQRIMEEYLLRVSEVCVQSIMSLGLFAFLQSLLRLTLVFLPAQTYKNTFLLLFCF